MNVSLTPELEKLVQKKVASGLYTSASEVIREALRLFENDNRLYLQKLESLKHEINIGLKDADEGRLIDGKQAFNNLKTRLKKK